MLMSRNLVLRPILSLNGLRPSTTSKLWMGRGMTFTTATRNKMVFCSPLSHLSTSVVNSTLASSSSSLSTCHASSIRSFATKSSSLSKILNRELQEEKETGTSEMPDFLVELQSKIQKDWSIMDDPDSGNVKMVKKTNLTNGSKVILLFHCQDSVDDEPEIDDEYHEEGEDDPEEPSPSVRFIVTLSKAGNTMVLNCLALGSTMSIESVATTKEDVDSILSRGKVADKAYQGPELYELAEDLQDSFATYLKNDCGIGSDVSSFIGMYSDFKEQQEYFKWIAMAKSIVS